jgi:hypothetical protein
VASYTSGDEVSGQVPVVSFFLSALQKKNAFVGGSPALMRQHVEMGLVVVGGCLLLLRTYYICFWGICFRNILGLGYLWE